MELSLRSEPFSKCCRLVRAFVTMYPRHHFPEPFLRDTPTLASPTSNPARTDSQLRLGSVPFAQYRAAADAFTLAPPLLCARVNASLRGFRPSLRVSYLYHFATRAQQSHSRWLPRRYITPVLPQIDSPALLGLIPPPRRGLSHPNAFASRVGIISAFVAPRVACISTSCSQLGPLLLE